MGRYVILRHNCPDEYRPGVHWDLMLESEAALRTWALAEAPAPDMRIAAEQLPDHRLQYLDYEGPISGNRGAVARWDEGEFELLRETPVALVVTLAGKRLRGTATLTRSAADDKTWQFILISQH